MSRKRTLPTKTSMSRKRTLPTETSMSWKRWSVGGLLAASLALTNPATAATLSLVVSDPMPELGETIGVDVAVSDLFIVGGGPTSVGSFEFEIGFDEELLAVVAGSLAFGTGLGSETCSFPPTPGCEAIVENGAGAGFVSFAAAALDLDEVDANQPDAFVLASFELLAIGSGTTSLVFDALALGSTSGDPLATTASAAEIRVPAVPEPASALLVGVALLWAGRAGERRRRERSA